MAQVQSDYEKMSAQLRETSAHQQIINSSLAPLKITLQVTGGYAKPKSDSGEGDKASSNSVKPWWVPDEKDAEVYAKAWEKSRSVLASFFEQASTYQSGMVRMSTRLKFDDDKQRKSFENTVLKDIAENRALQAAGVDQNGAVNVLIAGKELGIKQQDLSAFSADIGLFSAATGASASDVVSMWAEVRNTFRLSEKQAASLGDAAVYLGKAMDIKPQELLEIVAQNGDLSAKAGGSAQDGAVLAGVLVKSGLNKGDASLGLASLLQVQARDIKANTGKTLGFKDDLALKNGLKNDRAGTLINLLEGLSRLDPGQQTQQLMALFGEKRAALIGRALVDQKDDKGKVTGISERIQSARLDNRDVYKGSMAKNASAVVNTVQGKLAHMNGELSRLKTVLGDQLIPVVSYAADKLASVISVTADLASSHSTLAMAAMGIIGAVVAFKSLAGIIGIVKGLIGDAARVVASVFNHKKTKSETVLPSAKVSLASVSNEAAHAIHQLTKRIADLGSVSANSGYSNDVSVDNVDWGTRSGGQSDSGSQRKHGKNEKVDDSKHPSGSSNNKHRKGKPASAPPLSRDTSAPHPRPSRGTKRSIRSTGRKAVKALGGFLKSPNVKLALVEGALSLLDGSATDTLVSKGAGILENSTIISKISDSVAGEGGLLPKAAGVIGKEGRVVSKVLGSGSLKGAGKLAGKLFKPLGLIQDSWNLIEGVASGDSHQIGKAAGSAAGGWGGGLAGPAAGAAIGSVVPVVGTAIGGLVGGVLGSMGGSSIGEWVGDKAAGIYDRFANSDKNGTKDSVSGGSWLNTAKNAALTMASLTDLLPNTYSLNPLGGQIATLANNAWQGLTQYGDKSLHNINQTFKEPLASVLMPSGGLITHIFDRIENNWPAPDTMKTFQSLPQSRLWSPPTGANALPQQSSSHIVQNINVTLHATGNQSQNQQLIDQLMQRLRSELRAVGSFNGLSPLGSRINAGLTDGIGR